MLIVINRATHGVITRPIVMLYLGNIDPVRSVGILSGTPGWIDRRGDLAKRIIRKLAQLGGAIVVNDTSDQGRSADGDTSLKPGPIWLGLPGIISPDSGLQRFTNRFQESPSLQHIRCVLEMINQRCREIVVTAGCHGVLIPIEGIPIVKILVEKIHTGGDQAIAEGVVDSLVIFDSLMPSFRVEYVDRSPNPAAGILSENEGCLSIRRREHMQLASLIFVLGRNPDHIRVRYQQVGSVDLSILESRTPAEGIGDLRNFILISRQIVGEGRDLADCIRD